MTSAQMSSNGLAGLTCWAHGICPHDWMPANEASCMVWQDVSCIAQVQKATFICAQHPVIEDTLCHTWAWAGIQSKLPFLLHLDQHLVTRLVLMWNAISVL